MSVWYLDDCHRHQKENNRKINQGLSHHIGHQRNLPDYGCRHSTLFPPLSCWVPPPPLWEGGAGRQIEDSSSSTRYCAQPAKGGVKRGMDQGRRRRRSYSGEFVKKEISGSWTGALCETWLDDLVMTAMALMVQSAVRGIPLAGHLAGQHQIHHHLIHTVRRTAPESLVWPERPEANTSIAGSRGTGRGGGRWLNEPRDKPQ